MVLFFIIILVLLPSTYYNQLPLSSELFHENLACSLLQKEILIAAVVGFWGILNIFKPGRSGYLPGSWILHDRYPHSGLLVCIACQNQGIPNYKVNAL